MSKMTSQQYKYIQSLAQKVGGINVEKLAKLCGGETFWSTTSDQASKMIGTLKTAQTDAKYAEFIRSKTS